MTKEVVNVTQYEALSRDQQLDLLHRDGAHVGKRLVNNQPVILFQLNGFYVEVYYRDYRKQISQLLTSASPDILQPYLDQIPIRDLDTGPDKEP